MLNLRHYAEIELHQPKVQFEGIVTAELIHARTGLVAKRLEFKNIITDVGLNKMATKRHDSVFVVCSVGTGTNAPSAADTAMGNELARTTADGNIASTKGLAADFTYGWWRFTRVFTQAQANGNLTEIGFFGYQQTTLGSGDLAMRALFKDAGGNPTTVTKTSEYELRITYEIRNYIPQNDIVQVVPVNGVNQNVTTRAAEANSSNKWDPAYTQAGHMGGFYMYYRVCTGAIGAITSYPSGSHNVVSQSNFPHAAYVDGTFYRDVTITWGADTANVNGLQSFHLGDYAPFQHQLTTPFNKTNLQKLVVNARRSWGRYP